MSGWRFIAQRALTGEFIDWDVPMVLDSVPRRELSGPGSMTGTIAPEYARLKDGSGEPILAEWSTALFAELNGHIRWGGLLTHSGWDGGKWSLECAGYTAYPQGIPYLGPAIRSGYKTTEKPKYNDKNHDGYIDGTHPKRKMPKAVTHISTRLDAYEVVRKLWTHVQSYSHGDLNMVIDKHKRGKHMGAADGSDPYELLWWEAPDIGAEIDNLASTLEFDYAETHQWKDDDSQTIVHRLRLGDPRLGRRRSDLRFAQGENITALATPEGMGDGYYREVYALGKGSGSKTLHTRVIRSRDTQLRRVKVVSHKSVSSASRLRQLASRELKRHTQMICVPAIQVAQHRNAPIGSWSLGDDILVQIEVPWVGEIAVWHRITADETDPETDTATLTLTRTDAA